MKEGRWPERRARGRELVPPPVGLQALLGGMGAHRPKWARGTHTGSGPGRLVLAPREGLPHSQLPGRLIFGERLSGV